MERHKAFLLLWWRTYAQDPPQRPLQLHTVGRAADRQPYSRLQSFGFHKMVFFLYLLCICYVLFVWLVRLFFLLQSPHGFFWLCDDDACNLTDCSGNGCCFTDTPVRLILSVCLVTAFVFAVTALMLHRRSGKQSEGETPDSIWERSNIHYILYRIP